MPATWFNLLCSSASVRLPVEKQSASHQPFSWQPACCESTQQPQLTQPPAANRWMLPSQGFRRCRCSTACSLISGHGKRAGMGATRSTLRVTCPHTKCAARARSPCSTTPFLQQRQQLGLPLSRARTASQSQLPGRPPCSPAAVRHAAAPALPCGHPRQPCHLRCRPCLPEAQVRRPSRAWHKDSKFWGSVHAWMRQSLSDRSRAAVCDRRSSVPTPSLRLGEASSGLRCPGGSACSSQPASAPA